MGGEQGSRILLTLPWLPQENVPTLELSSNDELTLSPADHWPRFITLEAELSDSQPKPLTKMSPFLIQKGIQGIVGTPKSVKKLKSGSLLVEVT